MKKQNFITYLMACICMLYGFTCFSQNDKPLREPFNLRLSVDTINFYEQDVESSPYFVKEKLLQLYPTEKIYIEVETDKTGIKSMKTVKEIKHAEKTITIELKQVAKGKHHESMILSVSNPFKKKLNYKALMFIVGHNKWIETNVLPVEPKITSYETWPDVIISMVLSDWELE